MFQVYRSLINTLNYIKDLIIQHFNILWHIADFSTRSLISRQHFQWKSAF